jgi:hypothetical protein
MGSYIDTLISEYDIDTILRMKESFESIVKSNIKHSRDHLNKINKKAIEDCRYEEDLKNIIESSHRMFDLDTKSTIADYLSLEYFDLFKTGSMFLPNDTDYYISEVISYDIAMPTFDNDLDIPVITLITVRNTKNPNATCIYDDFPENAVIEYPCDKLKIERFFYKSTWREDRIIALENMKSK